MKEIVFYLAMMLVSHETDRFILQTREQFTVQQGNDGSAALDDQSSRTNLTKLTVTTYVFKKSTDDWWDVFLGSDTNVAVRAQAYSNSLLQASGMHDVSEPMFQYLDLTQVKDWQNVHEIKFVSRISPEPIRIERTRGAITFRHNTKEWPIHATVLWDGKVSGGDHAPRQE